MFSSIKKLTWSILLDNIPFILLPLIHTCSLSSLSFKINVTFSEIGLPKYLISKNFLFVFKSKGIFSFSNSITIGFIEKLFVLKVSLLSFCVKSKVDNSSSPIISKTPITFWFLSNIFSILKLPLPILDISFLKGFIKFILYISKSLFFNASMSLFFNLITFNFKLLNFIPLTTKSPDFEVNISISSSWVRFKRLISLTNWQLEWLYGFLPEPSPYSDLSLITKGNISLLYVLSSVSII